MAKYYENTAMFVPDNKNVVDELNFMGEERWRAITIIEVHDYPIKGINGHRIYFSREMDQL